MPLPQGLPRPELGWDITPGQPAPEPVDDPLDHPTVISERAARHAVRRGQQRLEPGPLGIGQDRTTRHPMIIPQSRSAELRDTP